MGSPSARRSGIHNKFPAVFDAVAPAVVNGTPINYGLVLGFPAFSAGGIGMPFPTCTRLHWPRLPSTAAHAFNGHAHSSGHARLPG